MSRRKLHPAIFFFLTLILIFFRNGFSDEVSDIQHSQLSSMSCKVIKIINGKNTSVDDSGPDCTSPVKMCTKGTLTEAGILKGTFYCTTLKIT